MGADPTPSRLPPCQPQSVLKQSLPSTKMSSFGLTARIALPALVAATGQFCAVLVTGQPFVDVSPVQQAPVRPPLASTWGSLRRSIPITIGLPFASVKLL